MFTALGTLTSIKKILLKLLLFINLIRLTVSQLLQLQIYPSYFYYDTHQTVKTAYTDILEYVVFFLLFIIIHTIIIAIGLVLLSPNLSHTFSRASVIFYFLIVAKKSMLFMQCLRVASETIVFVFLFYFLKQYLCLVNQY